jgi:hypothetical protein
VAKPTEVFISLLQSDGRLDGRLDGVGVIDDDLPDYANEPEGGEEEVVPGTEATSPSAAGSPSAAAAAAAAAAGGAVDDGINTGPGSSSSPSAAAATSPSNNNNNNNNRSNSGKPVLAGVKKADPVGPVNHSIRFVVIRKPRNYATRVWELDPSELVADSDASSFTNKFPQREVTKGSINLDPQFT